MTDKLFWIDPYQTELDTHIASVDGDWIELEQTIFFAFAGGQESDRGSIGGQAVLEARRQGQQIDYQLPPGPWIASRRCGEG